MASLKESAEQLQAKRGELAAIFAKYPDYNMPEDVVANVQERNRELSDLGKKFDDLKAVETIAEANRKSMEDAEKINRTVPFASEKIYDPKQNGINPNESQVAEKTLGELFVSSKGFTEWNSHKRSAPEVDFNVKTVFQTGSGGYPIQNIRTGTVVEYLQRPTIMDSIIPSGRTNMQAIVYMEEQAPVNGSAYVTENDPTKAESSFQFLERTVNIKKLRISAAITDEMMSDAPMMESYINNRLLVLFGLKKDTELLSGAGGSSITGLLNTGGIQTQARSTDPIPDAFHKALTKIQVNALVMPNAILIHPNDWQNVRLLRTADGIYVFGSPLDPSPTRMWGYNVQSTLALPQGTGLVGAFDTCTQSFMRQDVTLSVSSENEDNFMKGVLTIKAEMRLALVVYRPAGLCTVTGL